MSGGGHAALRVCRLACRACGSRWGAAGSPACCCPPALLLCSSPCGWSDPGPALFARGLAHIHADMPPQELAALQAARGFLARFP